MQAVARRTLCATGSKALRPIAGSLRPALRPAPAHFSALSTSPVHRKSAAPVTVHVPLQTFEEYAALASWVDPSELDLDKAKDDGVKMVDDEVEEVSVKGLVTKVAGDSEMVVTSSLNTLGVRDVSDLKLLKEEDLINHGVELITARKLLSQVALQPAASADGKPKVDPYAWNAPETMKFLAKKGILSAERNTLQIFSSGFLGGAYLGWGCCLTTVVAGGSSVALAGAPGALQLLTGGVFPVGLSMVLLSGGELLTGNFVTMALPAWTHPGVAKAQVISNTWKVWGLSGVGNMVGSVFVACAVAGLNVVVPGTPAANWLIALTMKKCSLSLGMALGKGAMANWLVNVAIFQASTAATTAGKIAALWFPIMTFVALGLEHSIANMFLLPLGMMLGADVTPATIVLQNWIPVAIGNALGAIVFVSGVARYSIMRNAVYTKPLAKMMGK